jgi:cobyrinic acid a,c-diamide synthase
MYLGYRQATIATDGLLGQAADVLRGHEFHYARVIDPGRDAPFAQIADGPGNPLGASGGRRGFVLGTFSHAIAKG